jgi:N-succinyldiaminopimelate aminotransferase
MLNPLLDKLTDFPFDRLRTLLKFETPPANVEAIDLSLGGPLHEPPKMVEQELTAHAAEWGRYPPMDGTPGFQNAASNWLCQRYGLRGDTFEEAAMILPVAGSREPLYMLATVTVPDQKADAKPVVLLPNPFYHIYEAAAIMSGAEPVFVPATAENDYLPDIASLDKNILERTALVYSCSPSNPQGKCTDLDYMISLIKLARKYHFVIAFDECYSEIYDKEPPPGGLQACTHLGPGFNRVVIFNSLSKRSSVPGLRSGLIAGDPIVLKKMRLLRTYGGGTVPMPIMAASAALLWDEKHVEANRALYREKFDVAEEILGNQFGFYRPEGGFFLWLDVGSNGGGETATKKLWSEAGVKVLPGAYLSRPDETGETPGSRYIRIALVEDVDTTRSAMRRIADTLGK